MKPEINRFKDYIRSIVTMDDDNFDMCSPYLKVSTIEKGDYLVKEGKICRHIAYIDSGLFRVFHLKNGTEVNSCFCTANSITSSFDSFLNESESQESIQAMEHSVLVTLSKGNLQRLYAQSLPWQAVGRLMTEKECLRLSNRASSLTFETAIEKYKKILEHQPDLLQRVSVQHIASYIGVSRETLSRIRKKVSEE